MKNGKTIILACSGASNTGAYSDKITRIFMTMGNTKMLCLTPFTVDADLVETQKNDISKHSRIIVLDGCPIDYAAKTLKKRGIIDFKNVHTTDFGIIKGKTPVKEEKIIEISDAILKSTFEI